MKLKLNQFYRRVDNKIVRIISLRGDTFYPAVAKLMGQEPQALDETYTREGKLWAKGMKYKEWEKELDIKEEVTKEAHPEYWL